MATIDEMCPCGRGLRQGKNRKCSTCRKEQLDRLDYSDKPCPCGRGMRYKSGARCAHCRKEDKAKSHGLPCSCGRGIQTVNGKCKQCHNEYAANWRANHPERRKKFARTASVKKLYGLTLEEYHALLEQPCAICGESEKRRVCDHDHKTGQVRGALCDKCNIALHHVENGDWWEKAKKYLEGGWRSAHLRGTIGIEADDR